MLQLLCSIFQVLVAARKHRYFEVVGCPVTLGCCQNLAIGENKILMSHKHADSLQHDAIDETVNSFILKRGRRYRGGGGGGGGGGW